MTFTTDIHSSASGFDMILAAVQKFNHDRLLYALQYKNWDEARLEKMAAEVTRYRERMEHEYDRLVEFSKEFNKEFATNDNECYNTALAMLRKLRSGISETKRIFRQFCPRARSESLVHAIASKPVSAYSYAYISAETYQLPLFSFDDYPPCISTLYNEMERFFFTLMRSIQLCKQVLEDECAIRSDGKYCQFLYESFRNRVLKEIADIIMLIPKDSAMLEEDANSAIQSRRKYADDGAWASVSFHSYTKKDVKHLIVKQVLEEEKGCDLTKEEILLFGNDGDRVEQWRHVIRHFDSLHPSAYRRRNLPAKYIQMFFRYVGIQYKLESVAVDYFNGLYTSVPGHRHTVVSYQAVNSYKKEVITDAKGEYTEFVKRLNAFLSSRNTTVDGFSAS